MSRLLEECGHEVLVANARKVRLIYGSKRKNDELDAENLARLARLDPKLLYPLRHRGEESQAHLALVRSREALVGSRTRLINHLRGASKSFGHRLCPSARRPASTRRRPSTCPRSSRRPSDPSAGDHRAVDGAHPRVRARKLEEVAAERYPETEALRRVRGVGALTALSFVLVLEDPSRYAKSRAVGACTWDSGVGRGSVGGERPPTAHLQGGRRGDAKEAPGRERPLSSSALSRPIRT